MLDIVDGGMGMAFTLLAFLSWLCGSGYEYIYSGAGASDAPIYLRPSVVNVCSRITYQSLHQSHA